MPFRKLLLVVIAACSIVACGDDDGTGPTQNASVEITNGSSRTIVELYYSACTDPGWGNDRLGNSDLAVGASRTFSIPPGCWDFLSVNDQGVEDELLGEELEAGETYEYTIVD